MEEETRNRLEQLLQRKGYRPKPDSQDLDKKELWFTDGRSTLTVRVLEDSETRNRNAILDAALSALSLASKANLVYLALPKLHASLLDASILQSRGLGLITHDVRTVEEVVVAKRIDQALTRSESSADMELMKNRIVALERTVETLASELSVIRAKRIELERPRRQTPSETVDRGKKDALPSFFKDNPWLDILANRAKEPDRDAA